MDAERLRAVKAYMQVDYDADDALIGSLLSAAEAYLGNIGVERSISPAQYDLIVFDMTLRVYDGRDADVSHAATSQMARQMLTQLKLLSAYGGVP